MGEAVLRRGALRFRRRGGISWLLLQGVWDGSGWGAHRVNAAALLVLFAAYTALSTRVWE